MGNAFNGQTALKIILDTGQDITGATALIKYQKPDGTTGSWVATTESSTAGTISISATTGNIDQSGKWALWSYVTFADGTIAPGESVLREFYTEGSDY